MFRYFRYLGLVFCLVVIIFLVLLFDGGGVLSHSGRTDSSGGHYHGPARLMPYPAEDFTEAPTYKVLKTSTTKITIEKDGQPMSVRLLGIHTSWLLSDRGSTFLRDLLMGELVYLLHSQKSKGRVNTLDAYVYRAPDGLFVNLELIRLGYAQAGAPAGTHQPLLKHYGERAKSVGKGFWDRPKEIKVKTLWD